MSGDGVDELLAAVEGEFDAEHERLRENKRFYRDFLVADCERLERVLESNRAQIEAIEERWGL